MFGVEDVGDGLEVQICLCARISLEEGGRETIETIHSADRGVLGDFLVCELTPEFEKELIVTFEFCRVKRYEQYWFFNIDNIVLGEYPLEKIPEHLHDIVKEARGE
ncbi:hypothetical protein K8R78_08035 [bacterium]|nr:hypothetical protein [bacterium]